MSVIDLSQLPAPSVVETIDFETLLAERKASLIALYPDDEKAAITATLALESEPITKLLQENAYREMVLRQRVNEAAKAVMLAYAEREDLDQIGANYKVSRLIINAGDPDAIPPVDPIYESDNDFRYRIQLSLEGYTTAGSTEAYVFHGLSSDGDVKDIEAISPSPGHVSIYVLSRSGDGSASPELINKVNAALNADHIRPMTDKVSVLSATIVNYSVIAELVILPGPDSSVVTQTAIEAMASYAETQRKIGYDITLSGIYAALHQPGVQRVNLTTPVENIVIGSGQSSYCTGITVTVAGATDV